MMAGDFLNDYVFLTVGRWELPAGVTQSFQFVDGRDKPEALMRYPNVDQHGLLWSLSRRSAMRTSWRASHVGGLPASSIGDKTRDRELACVISRPAARAFSWVGCSRRGQDIPNVLHVISFDLPERM